MGLFAHCKADPGAIYSAAGDADAKVTSLGSTRAPCSSGTPRRCPDDLLSSCFQVALTPEILDGAGLLEPARLSSLDAIHLACARLIESELDAFVAYDERLAAAAASAGLTVASPGPR